MTTIAMIVTYRHHTSVALSGPCCTNNAHLCIAKHAVQDLLTDSSKLTMLLCPMQRCVIQGE